jgi:hypothetical protein
MCARNFEESVELGQLKSLELCAAKPLGIFELSQIPEGRPAYHALL